MPEFSHIFPFKSNSKLKEPKSSTTIGVNLLSSFLGLIISIRIKRKLVSKLSTFPKIFNLSLELKVSNVIRMVEFHLRFSKLIEGCKEELSSIPLI